MTTQPQAMEASDNRGNGQDQELQHSCPELQHNCQQLQHVFQQCFLTSHNTVLQGGAEEPLYSPASGKQLHHVIAFTQDYYASALHEIAHWLVAGETRRLQEDYGYWYAPDGRDAKQQLAFEQVEIRPQALEWMLSQAAGFRFQVSADNLQAGMGASAEFKANIHAQVLRWCEAGLNQRSMDLLAALSSFYGNNSSCKDKAYQGNVYQADRYQLAQI